MNTALKGRKRLKKRPATQYRDYAFTTTDRAQIEYLQANQALLDLVPKMKGKAVIQIRGNIVSIPAWFPYKPSF